MTMRRRAETLSAWVRPMMLVMLFVMIGPLALVVGALEAFLPGMGERFGIGVGAYLRALPEAFWGFASAAYGFYAIARSFGHDKRRRGDAPGPDPEMEELR